MHKHKIKSGLLMTLLKDSNIFYLKIIIFISSLCAFLCLDGFVLYTNVIADDNTPIEVIRTGFDTTLQVQIIAGIIFSFICKGFFDWIIIKFGNRTNPIVDSQIKIADTLDKLTCRLEVIEGMTKETLRMHSKFDDNGVPVWYSPGKDLSNKIDLMLNEQRHTNELLIKMTTIFEISNKQR